MENSKSSNKSFGIVFTVFFLILAIYQYVRFEKFNIYLIIFSIIFLLFSFIYPKIFTPLNNIWIKFGELLGKVIAPIVMFVIYFSIISITSLLLKLFGKDIMGLKVNNKTKTFWKLRKIKPQSMNKQF